MVTAQRVIPLYNGVIPNSKQCSIIEKELGEGRVEGVTKPMLYAYFPEKKDSLGTAVIICPGGGYGRLAMNHEGVLVAKEFNKRGITAFVLKYRLPKAAACVENTETVAQMDAQQAIKIVRENATNFNISPNNIRIMGFSAGGHLASTLATHYTNCLIENKENTSLRPDFLILGYPVISFEDSICHKGSRENMLGKDLSAEKIQLYSNELQVTAKTPPTFLIHAADDKAVKVENSLNFYLALRSHQVPAEIHILQKGGHGFGLVNKLEPINGLSLTFAWLKANSLMQGNVE